MKQGRSLADIAAELMRQKDSQKDYIAPQGKLQATVVNLSTQEPEMEASRLKHGWDVEKGYYTDGEDEDDCWCLCHRQDWSVEHHELRSA